VKLATVRWVDGTLRAVRIDGDEATLLDATDVGELLAEPGWRARAAAASGPRSRIAQLDYAPLIPRPDKIICIGLNYRKHAAETGNPVPKEPILFISSIPRSTSTAAPFRSPTRTPSSSTTRPSW
jgi:acylpyruvate hydrolase